MYLLCRTSNTGAGELQALEVAADPDRAPPVRTAGSPGCATRLGLGAPPGTVGLVVGATAPNELSAIRAIAPGLPFLVPGVGSQGGDASTAVESGRSTTGPAARLAGGALLVNVSRAIADAARTADDPARGSGRPRPGGPGPCKC